MQNERESPKITDGIFHYWTQRQAEKRRRAYEEQRDAVRMAHQERLEEKRISARMEEARENRQLQEKLAADAAQNQLKIALFNAEVQWKLSQINAENQEQMALFQAGVQRELAEFNAKNQLNLSVNTAELNYNLQNFPLYIRSWSLKDSLRGAGYLPVKVVVIPPEEGGSKWKEFLTSHITYFMQKNIPNSYYEFLGGAWREGRCTGQTAYHLIYEEFREEPFLILDCDVMEKSRLSIRICFWYPESSGIQVRQFINDWDITSILNLPQDHMNGASWENEYSYQCMRFCSAICEMLIGVVVDIYQLSAGTARDSEMLKRLPGVITEFSGQVPKKIACDLGQGILEEYESLVKEAFVLDPRARLHCTCGLAATIYELRRSGLMKISESRRKAEGYMKSAWEQWCQLMGISVEELGSILRSESESRTLCDIIKEDAVSSVELKVIYDLYDKMNNSNDKLVSLLQKIGKNGEVQNEMQ